MIGKLFGELELFIKLSLEKTLVKDDGKKIWRHFQRFCEHSDLKDLENQVIPEIFKFEKKMNDIKKIDDKHD